MRILPFFGIFVRIFPALAAACGAPPVMVTDAVTGQRWAQVVDCAHPEWPAKLVPASSVAHQPAAAHVAADQVRAGSVVNLWTSTGARMHLKGIALESAAIGQPVHVRSVMGSAPLRGIVRGAESVEIVPAGWGRKP